MFAPADWATFFFLERSARQPSFLMSYREGGHLLNYLLILQCLWRGGARRRTPPPMGRAIGANLCWDLQQLKKLLLWCPHPRHFQPHVVPYLNALWKRQIQGMKQDNQKLEDGHPAEAFGFMKYTSYKWK